MNGRFMVSVMVLVLWAGLGWGQVEVEWERTFNRQVYGQYHNSTNERLTDFIRMSDGGYALTGQTEIVEDRGYIHRQLDYWVVRTDSVGDLIWSNHYGGERDEQCIKIIQLSGGDILLFGNSGASILVVKINQQGDSLDAWSYPVDWGQVVYDAILLPNENYLLATQKSFRFGEEQYSTYPTLMEINSAGEIVLERTYATGYFHSQSIVPLSNGGYSILGTLGSVREDGGILRLNEDYDSLWFKTYDREFEDYFTGIVERNNGNITMAGWGRTGEYPNSIWLIEADEFGDTLWTRVIVNQGQSQTCFSIINTLDNGFCMAGDLWDRRAPQNAGGTIIKTDSLGQVSWELIHGHNGSIEFRKVIQLEDGSYVTAGRFENDFYLVKTTPDPVSVRDHYDVHPSSFILNPPFPNPFNSTTTIRFSAGLETGPTLLGIFDPLGRRVADLIPGRLTNTEVYPTGRVSVIWNATGFPAGEYFIRLEAGGEALTRSVTLVR